MLNIPNLCVKSLYIMIKKIKKLITSVIFVQYRYVDCTFRHVGGFANVQKLLDLCHGTDGRPLVKIIK